MKKIASIIILALLGYFLFNRLSESDDPSYMRYEIQKPVESIEIGITVLEKLPPSLSCAKMESRRTGFIRGFLRDCTDCLLISSLCKEELGGVDQIMFEDRVTGRPYFSYEKGGLFSQQDFRVLFPDLSDEALGALCIELSDQLRRTTLFFLGGKTECVRPSE